MTLDSTSPEEDEAPDAPASGSTEVLVLAVAWCRDEPWRVGEVLVVPPGEPGPSILFGRGANVDGQPAKSALGQLRPGQWLPSPALEVAAISRYQFSAQSLDATRLAIKNLGRCPLAVNGEWLSEAELVPGDLLLLGKQLLLLCVSRSRTRSPAALSYPEFPFGQPDAHGIVGESQVAWHLRHQAAFIAARRGHVLICGASGSGKELVARAIHALSPRAERALVARNAATLPENLIDAELFGNAKNYPNPGMADRPGLIGEAHGSTLLLDEFAELPTASQAHLLRVLDGGEYQRLGESKSRVSDLRLIAATNRNTQVLKHDLLARFAFKVTVPDLSERIEDIPLLTRHILRREAARGDAVSLEHFPDSNLHLDPVVPLRLMSTLLEADLPTNVRDLESRIWESIAQERLGSSKTAFSDRASTPPQTQTQRDQPSRLPNAVADSERPSEQTLALVSGDAAEKLSPEQIQRCLDENNGVIETSWRALGLANRFVLQRLIRKYRLNVTKKPWKLGNSSDE